MKLVEEYTRKHLQAMLPEHKSTRRKLLIDKDQEGYEWELRKWQNTDQLTRRLVQANLYQALKIGKSIFERSDEAYRSDPERNKVFQ